MLMAMINERPSSKQITIKEKHVMPREENAAIALMKYEYYAGRNYITLTCE